MSALLTEEQAELAYERAFQARLKTFEKEIDEGNEPERAGYVGVARAQLDACVRAVTEKLQRHESEIERYESSHASVPGAMAFAAGLREAIRILRGSE